LAVTIPRWEVTLIGKIRVDPEGKAIRREVADALRLCT
jgi:hypothetical protein